MPVGCKHRPPCPASVVTWTCHDRTVLEAALAKGEISLKAAQRLAEAWGVPLSPRAKNFKAEALPPIPEKLW